MKRDNKRLPLLSTLDILREVKSRRLSVKDAERLLKLDALAVVDEIARLDLNRHLRRGVPEIVYSAGKSDTQLINIARRLIQDRKDGPSNALPIIFSKASRRQFSLLRTALFSGKTELDGMELRHHASANIMTIGFALAADKNKDASNSGKDRGRVCLLCAGTSDISVLDEAQVFLNEVRCETMRFNDVGIASLKRLSEPLRQIQTFDPDALIVAAGMEGALPSLIASLSSVPVIGVPTSVGYGYGKRGEAALMSMLQACPLGITVVNIDGGIAAGVIAWLIAKRCVEARASTSNNFDLFDKVRRGH